MSKSAIIIEDEDSASNLLKGMIKKIEPSLHIAAICKDLPTGVAKIKEHAPDVVFLDIKLPVHSGLELLDFFQPAEISFEIVFTTAYNEYAIKAFEMSAVDYLLKPFQEDRLRTAIERLGKRPLPLNEIYQVLRQHLQRDHNKIVVPIGSGLEILPLNDICYLQADGSYSKLNFRDGTSLVVSKNLKHFEQLLETAPCFIRVHRSFIVNLNFARKFLRVNGCRLYLEDHAEIPVSEEKASRVIELLKTL